jgi:hypothetical protein
MDEYRVHETSTDVVEAHYSGLERPCACFEGWVFVGYVDEHGEEREASYRCHCGEDERHKVCAICGAQFVAKRADAKTCSPRCRQRLRRRS